MAALRRYGRGTGLAAPLWGGGWVGGAGVATGSPAWWEVGEGGGDGKGDDEQRPGGVEEWAERTWYAVPFYFLILFF
jgi:hypothetical protein